jgi:hypothetical protein
MNRIQLEHIIRAASRISDDTKERIDGHDGKAKSRTEHREYGRALILTYDNGADRFIRVEFDPVLGRNREARTCPRNPLSELVCDPRRRPRPIGPAASMHSGNEDSAKQLGYEHTLAAGQPICPHTIVRRGNQSRVRSRAQSTRTGGGDGSQLPVLNQSFIAIR